MGKTLQKLVDAFYRQESYYRTVLNTTTDGRRLALYNNVIAEHRDDGLYVTLAGWPTATTCDRLSLLPNVRVHHTSCDLYLNGVKWDGQWTRVADELGNLVDIPESEPAQLLLGNVRRTKREQMSYARKSNTSST